MDHRDIMKMRFRQLEHLARQMDARDIRVRHANTRRQWLQRQNNSAYRQEYDRIRGELAHTVLSDHDKRRLQAREAQLAKLFSHGNV